VDWKPQARVYLERRLQLSAYLEALRAMGWPDMDRAVVALPRDGGAVKLVRLEDDHRDTVAAFRALLGIYRWQAQMRKGAA
jgi:hypothetical protein